MTATPEPGQPVWIAAEVVPSVAGHPMLTPITAVGQPSTIRLAPARYRWQPVPPQPPVLAVDSEVLLVDRRTTWRVATWDCIEDEDGQSAIVVLRPKYAPLADVPGPDDTTPTPEPADDPQWAISLHLRCGDHSPFGVECDRVANHSGRHMACGLDLEVRDSWANEPQPAGEGAALIAATAQETAQPANPAEWVPMLEVLAGQADAWEATARRACAKLDELVRSVGVIRPWLVRHGFPAGDTRHLPQQAVDALEELHGDVEAAQQAPVQATTHGEAGEAQEGAEGAAEQFNLDTVRCPDCGNEITGILNEGDSFPRHKSPTTPQGCPYPSTRALIVAEHFTRRRKPAVQGAGRDWRGEIMQTLADRTGDTLEFWADEADAIVAALGLHDLEQAAGTALDVSSRRWSAIVQGLRAEIVHRKATEADLRAEVSQWQATYGEAGEAQEGAQAAPRVANSSTGANGSLPAVQGAGRDWRDILAVLQRDGAVTPASPIAVLHNPAVTAERIAEALGLHDLEQAAEQWHDYWSQAVAERDTEARLRRSEIAGADKLAADLRAERDEALVDRDAARRELEQLRGENARLRRRMTQLAEDPRMTVYLLQQRLRSALDAGAPATQDGDPK